MLLHRHIRKSNKSKSSRLHNLVYGFLSTILDVHMKIVKCNANGILCSPKSCWRMRQWAHPQFINSSKNRKGCKAPVRSKPKKWRPTFLMIPQETWEWCDQEQKQKKRSASPEASPRSPGFSFFSFVYHW